jgi:O-antigen/teichoic acid export membrane protein
LQEASWPLVLVTAALVPVIAQMKKLMGLLAGFRKPAQSRVPDGLVRPGLLLCVGAAGLTVGLLDETGLLAVYLAAALCAALVGQLLVRRADPLPHPGEAEYHSADWWRSLGPLTLFVAAGTINTYADILMIGAMESSASVAHYRIASQIAGISLLVQVAVNAVIGPRIAAFNVADDYDRMQGMAVRGCRLAFGATLLFSGLLYTLGVDGFVALLGPEYAPVYPLAVALAFGTAVQTFFGGATWILNMTRREKSSATYALISAGGNILLNLALIPILGAFGAVIATVITNLLMQGLAWNRIRRDLDIRSDAFARVRV